jgi:ferric-dicitrate binding protein FerR (iron transport regulator)
LFTVVHDARHPFVVRTARTTVRDVGTTFDVRAYAADANERVTVAEGEVAVAGVALHARDAASLDASGHVTVRRNVDVSAPMAWVQGRLVFEDTPLADAARMLARTYDLDMTIADSTLGTELVTASFAAGESAGEVLRAVTLAVGAHYEQTGRKVVIRRGAVPAGHPGATPGAASLQRLTRAGTDR